MIPLFMQHGRSGPTSPIKSLFTAGMRGVWYDPSDFSTLFQDSAGTIPVTAVGQPVGLMLDKSGNGNHAVQAASAKIPTLSQDAGGFYSLYFDGVDDAITASNVDLSVSKMTVFTGTRRDSSTLSQIAEFGPQNSNGGFRFVSASNYGAYIAGVGGRGTSSITAPDTKIFTLTFDRARLVNSGGVLIRLNGVSNMVTATGTTAPGGLFGKLPLYIGSRAGTSSYFKGRLYSLIIVGKTASSAEYASVEAEISNKMGVVL